jgi:hypothetical protein
MLKTSELEIEINNRTRNYYKSLGYDVNKNMINVNIKDIPKSSGRYIDCSCDDCEKEMKMTYQNYNIGLEKNDKTICNKCNRKYIINPFSKQEIKDKIKKTLINKYNFDNPMKSNMIKDKRDATMLEKYGNTYSFGNKEIKEKMENKIKNRTEEEKKLIYEKIKNKTDFKKSRENFEKTMLKKYGVKNALENEDIKKIMIDKINNKTTSEKEKIKLKIKETNINLFGVEYPMKLKCFKEKSSKTKRMNSIIKFIEKHKDLKIFDINYDDGVINAICDKHGKYSIGISAFYHRWRENHNMCVKCNELGTYNKTEKEILDFIKSNYINEINTHNRKILNNELELDIYLPDLKLAFEFNGLYWHSELYKPNNYHLNKTEECEKLGIHLIHIYEDDWIYKQDIVKSRILNLFGKSDKIFARKCSIREIDDNKIIREFLEKNHQQGFVGSKVKIGLFYDDELVSLMTFGNLRKPMNQKSSGESYEMLRFCNKLNTNVIGGASRLFKYFIEKYKLKEITSYADRSWSNGNLYEKLGFTLVHKTQPNYYYIINKIRKYRFNYRKNKLIKEGADPNKTEHEIMLEKGIFRIYDSGSLKYVY